jgi:hypothetical protein
MTISLRQLEGGAAPLGGTPTSTVARGTEHVPVLIQSRRRVWISPVAAAREAMQHFELHGLRREDCRYQQR